MDFTTPLLKRLGAPAALCASLLLLAPLGGCAGDDGTGSTSASTGSGTDSASSTSTSGSGSDASSSGSSGAASASGSGSSGDTSTSDTSATDTSGGVVCELDALACGTVEQYGSYEDCGEVNPWDNTLSEWTALRECALKASAEERGFKAITWVMGIDSNVGYAYVGLSAETFAVAEFYYDSYNPTGMSRYCDALVATPDCTVAPGEACLTCAGTNELELLCGR